MCIHASKETADLLAAQGKEKWLRPRTDSVAIKGKGSSLQICRKMPILTISVQVS